MSGNRLPDYLEHMRQAAADTVQTALPALLRDLLNLKENC
jgi:hypothetical protein